MATKKAAPKLAAKKPAAKKTPAAKPAVKAPARKKAAPKAAPSVEAQLAKLGWELYHQDDNFCAARKRVDQTIVIHDAPTADQLLERIVAWENHEVPRA